MVSIYIALIEVKLITTFYFEFEDDIWKLELSSNSTQKIRSLSLTVCPGELVEIIV